MTLTITLEKKTQISRLQFKKLSFCSSNVLGTFLYKKSRTQVKFSANELSDRIANDFFTGKSTFSIFLNK